MQLESSHLCTYKLNARLSYTDKPVQNNISDFSAILVPISRLENVP